MTVVAGKRGHHSDFALSKDEVDDLISFISNRRTKAMVILASLGVPVRGIVIFKASHHILIDKGDYVLDITGVTASPIKLTPKQGQFLHTFREGLDLTNVSIWRRIRKEVVAAGKAGIITFDPDHIPFPAALAYEPAETLPSSLQMVKWCLERLHSLPGHNEKDCDRIRTWLTRKEGP